MQQVVDIGKADFIHCMLFLSQVGLVYGSDLSQYSGTLLDYAYGSYDTSIIAAHISCCDFPSEKELPEIWKQNLNPIMAFLKASTQGVFGQVSYQP